MNMPTTNSTVAVQHILESQTATQALAQSLAGSIKPGDIIFLEGDLGTGKTFFSQALIRSFGITSKVLSPTYSLVQTYDIHLPMASSLSQSSTCNNKQPNSSEDVRLQTTIQLHHFDLYRLASPDELEFIGIRDYLTDSSINLIEWPSKAQDLLPPATLHINLEYLPDTTDGRIANIKQY